MITIANDDKHALILGFPKSLLICLPSALNTWENTHLLGTQASLGRLRMRAAPGFK